MTNKQTTRVDQTIAQSAIANTDSMLTTDRLAMGVCKNNLCELIRLIIDYKFRL